MHQRSDRRDCSPEKLSIGGKLLEQTFATHNSDNRNQIALTHFVVYVIKQHLSYGGEILDLQVQVVEHKRNNSLQIFSRDSAISRLDIARQRRTLPFGSRRTFGADELHESNVLLFPVVIELEILELEIRNDLIIFVGDDDICLDQRSANANDIVRRSFLLRLLGRTGCLRKRGIEY